jgi:ATP-dependent Clp protease ATP-binding subunit ClpB
MNLQKYTQKSMEALQSAQSMAQENGNPQLRQEHVLLALLRGKEGLIPELIRKCGASPEALAARLEQNSSRWSISC